MHIEYAIQLLVAWLDFFICHILPWMIVVLTICTILLVAMAVESLTATLKRYFRKRKNRRRKSS